MINILTLNFIDGNRKIHGILPVIIRLVFASTLLFFFWKSALTKIEGGVFGFLHPSTGAYFQIFPKAFEASGYDPSAMSWLQWAIVLAGTYAEFILPLLIVIGLFTRWASIAMIGFIAVMSVVDIFGHGVDPGKFFDGDPSGIIADQRLFWVTILLTLFYLGGGYLSVDLLYDKKGNG